MDTDGGDKVAALVTDPVNVYYLTGFMSEPFERFMGLLLPPRAAAEPTLIVPALDGEKAAAQSRVQEIVTYRDDEDPHRLLASILQGLRPAALAVEKRHLTVGRHEAILGAVPGLQIRDVSAYLATLRSRKDHGEIELMRRAAQITCQALAAGISALEEGASEVEAAATLDYQLRRLGADGPAFPSTVLVGPDSALPHGNPGDRRPEPGDMVLFDFGARYRGYCADITRTFAFRRVEEEMARVYELVRAAEQAGVAAARAGVAVADVDRACRQVIEEGGYGPYFVHRTGHGLGLEAHEPPSLGADNRARLEAGTVVTVEPGIYLPGRGGVRIEDDVVVTEGGDGSGAPLVLTDYPKDLKLIG